MLERESECDDSQTITRMQMPEKSVQNKHQHVLYKKVHSSCLCNSTKRTVRIFHAKHIKDLKVHILLIHILYETAGDFFASDDKTRHVMSKT